MAAFCLDDRVVVPPFNLRPLNKAVRRTEPSETVTLKDVQDRASFTHLLTMNPASVPDIKLYYRYPSVTPSGRQHPSLVSTGTAVGQLIERAGERYARINYEPIGQKLKGKGVKSTWKIDLTLEYAVDE